MSLNAVPLRGEIWLVNFDPTIGAEIRKVRPAIVISSDSLGKLPLKLVAPLTEWKGHFAWDLWHIRVEPDPMNGLQKTSTVDALQVRCVDVKRFVRRLGRASPATMSELTSAVAAVIEHS